MHSPWPTTRALQLSPGLSSSSWKDVRSQSSARASHVSPASTRVVGWQPDRSEPSLLSPARRNGLRAGYSNVGEEAREAKLCPKCVSYR